MKKSIIVIGLTIILFGAFIFFNKLYYPSLPIESMSKKEVLEKINDADKEMVQLSNEKGKKWFIVSERNVSVADEMIKEMVIQNGWIFKQKDGSGLFFEKKGESLIVTTQKWTGDYVLVEIPVNFNE
ncbi:hypothetical protein CSE16_18115 [Solibacillus sp. R5-41]|uniref:hypothetical protein n=1 Tax=Solibacillus sp. R5-41 TaxID=2048654 RepID=UPI000C129541|nr:hypothetical protein [Solibacillus sp. R5-41]ATP41797.1 hypothetical protein CSE16_18115 [Solibacillus sp. R5-41]